MPRSKPKAPPASIDPNRIKGRDPLLTKLILGATKGGAQVDRRKEANRNACREDTMNAKTPNKPNHRTVLNENLQSIQELKAAKATIAKQEKELEQIRGQLKAANERIAQLLPPPGTVMGGITE